MNYSYKKYLRTLAPNDVNIQIKDNNGNIKWTIEPYSVLSVLVNNNLLKINLENEVIIIAFQSLNEAIMALSLFQEQLDELKSRIPIKIDKKISNFLNNYISKEELKQITSESVDFDDFKNRISEL
jgi:hypothetical protein